MTHDKLVSIFIKKQNAKKQQKKDTDRKYSRQHRKNHLKYRRDKDSLRTELDRLRKSGSDAMEVVVL